MEGSQLMLSPVSAPVHSLLQQHLQQAVHPSAPHDPPKHLTEPSTFVEFDDYKYHMLRLKAPAPGSSSSTIQLSLAAPSDECMAVCEAYGGLQQLPQLLSGIAERATSPLPGYHLTLTIDLAAIAAASPDSQQAYLQRLASVRSLVCGAPLRHHFQQLLQGCSVPVLRMPARPSRGWYIVPGAEGLRCIFPMTFFHPDDVAIATAFLQEFVEGGRAVKMKHAPVVAHLPARARPHELAAFPEEAAEAGYVVFTFFRSNVTAAKLEALTWAMLSFPAFVACHVRALKTWLRARMRSRLDAMLTRLDAPASPTKRAAAPWHTQGSRASPSPPGSPRATAAVPSATTHPQPATAALQAAVSQLNPTRSGPAAAAGSAAPPAHRSANPQPNPAATKPAPTTQPSIHTRSAFAGSLPSFLQDLPSTSASTTASKAFAATASTGSTAASSTAASRTAASSTAGTALPSFLQAPKPKEGTTLVRTGSGGEYSVKLPAFLRPPEPTPAPPSSSFASFSGRPTAATAALAGMSASASTYPHATSALAAGARPGSAGGPGQATGGSLGTSCSSGGRFPTVSLEEAMARLHAEAAAARGGAGRGPGGQPGSLQEAVAASRQELQQRLRGAPGGAQQRP